MLRKIIAVIAIFVLINFFFACGCPEPETIYRWNSVSTEILNDEKITSSDSISFNNYGIRISIEPLQIADYLQNCFVNSAFARKCIDYKVESDIKEIMIRTLSRFDNDHPINSDITSYCKAKRTDESLYMPVSKITTHTGPRGTNEYNIILTQQPDSVSNYQFVIELFLENGVTLKDTTRSVVIY